MTYALCTPCAGLGFDPDPKLALRRITEVCTTCDGHGTIDLAPVVKGAVAPEQGMRRGGRGLSSEELTWLHDEKAGGASGTARPERLARTGPARESATATGAPPPVSKPRTDEERAGF